MKTEVVKKIQIALIAGNIKMAVDLAQRNGITPKQFGKIDRDLRKYIASKYKKD